MAAVKGRWAQKLMACGIGGKSPTRTASSNMASRPIQRDGKASHLFEAAKVATPDHQRASVTIAKSTIHQDTLGLRDGSSTPADALKPATYN